MMGDLDRFEELVMDLLKELVLGERAKVDVAKSIAEMAAALKNHTFSTKYRR